jgi:hypothetical protein
MAHDLSSGPSGYTDSQQSRGVLICEDIDNFLRQDCDAYPAMYVPRNQEWADLQDFVDALAGSDAFDAFGGSVMHEMKEEIQTLQQLGSEQLFTADVTEKAQRLVKRATASGLPADIGDFIVEDFKQIASVLTKLVPTAGMIIKLEVMGANGCSRWHRDNYIGRAIVTYNGRGTEYVDHEDVDFWELENCGNNQCILRAGSEVHSTSVGGILFMKGKSYPSVCASGEKGLVHRSPDPQLHANGNVMNRLLLKVDLVQNSRIPEVD